MPAPLAAPETILPTDEELAPFQDIGLTAELLRTLIDEHEKVAVPRYERLWMYYRNALAEPDASGASSAPPRQAAGLPARLQGFIGATGPFSHQGSDPGRIGPPPPSRDVVIENDIAWRIHTLCDFMFPKPPTLSSSAADPDLRRIIDALLHAIIERSGGASLWQNAALLGSVYGHVEFVLDHQHHPNGSADRNARIASPDDAMRRADDVAEDFRIDVIEAPRVIALLNARDFRALDALIIHHEQPTTTVQSVRETTASLIRRVTQRLGLVEPRIAERQRDHILVTTIFSATHMQRYEDGVLVQSVPNQLKRIPAVHVQNLTQPLYWEGLSDVEPLIPLQDELNTRLSDRANRVTMQSFRMWLAKGIDDFTNRPVGPGQMWATDNLDASIEAFGGDAASPSESMHLEELREALDKASGVTPAAAGHIKARVGNLTSENALRISLMGTIAKTKRKRVTYGAGIRALCELILHALHVRGVLPTDPADRLIDVRWSDPLPPDESRRITDALNKAQLGVPQDVLLSELGYGADHAE